MSSSLLKLGDGYLGIHYIILSAFTNVWNFPKQNVEKNEKEGGREADRKEGKE